MFRSGYAVLAVAMASLIANSAQAGTWDHWNTLSRKLGLGWSAGYHAHEGFGTPGHLWITPAPVEVSRPPARHVEPAAVPTPRPDLAPRTSQKPRNNEPILPSQQFTPRPTYWYR